jgi:hypothetical protein
MLLLDEEVKGRAGRAGVVLLLAERALSGHRTRIGGSFLVPGLDG